MSFRKGHLTREDDPKNRGPGAHSCFGSTTPDRNDSTCKNENKCWTSQTAELMHPSCNRLWSDMVIWNTENINCALESSDGESFSPSSHTEVWNSTTICPLWLSTCKISLYFLSPSKLLHVSLLLPTSFWCPLGSIFVPFSSLSIITITPRYPNCTAIPLWYAILYDLSTSYLHTIWSISILQMPYQVK